MKALILSVVIGLILISSNSFAQNYFADTVWTKITDQYNGFYQVKFSKNDSIIVGNGYQNAIFYNSINAEEIARIPFNTEVHFIQNDTKYIQLAPSRKKLNIYDTKTHILLDSIQNDGTDIGAIIVSKDERNVFGAITNGIRVWDLLTKTIVKTKIFPIEEGQTLIEIYSPKVLNDNLRAIITIYREYQKNNQTEVRRYYPVYNLMTLDSIDRWEFFDKGATWYQLSNTNNYLAIKTGDPTYGVEIYDFNTKQLIHKLPINGPSLTGIEFSPDDKYIVTSNGPGANSLIIWDIATGNEIHRYWPSSYSTIDVSHNGLFILGVYGRRLRYFYARFSGTSVPEISTEVNYLYPNPTTREVYFKTSLEDIETIKIYDINGNEYPQTKLEKFEDGIINFKVSSLPSGKYIIKIKGLHEIQSYTLIINK